MRAILRVIRRLGVATGVALLVGLPVAVPAHADAAPEADAGMESHLRRGLAYWQAGDLARARFEFESVLLLDGLPPDLDQQAAIYAAVAQARLAGQQLVATGYATASAGRYRERDSIAGNGEADDGFAGLRVGGRVNYLESDDLTMKASLDYWLRGYDNADRRRDSDLLWDLGFARVIGRLNLAYGGRGWISYRGERTRRNDHGLYAKARLQAGDDHQFGIGMELRRRSYPEGRLRDLSRDIVEVQASWEYALLDGRASLALAGRAGREFARNDRPDGDANFFGLSPSFNWAISETIGINVYGWWQNDRFNFERYHGNGADVIAGASPRNDDLYEVGGGMTWNFAPGWELNPGFLHLRDSSNVVALNYRSTEVYLALRRDF